MKNTTTPAVTGNHPAHQIRYGVLSASIWRQDTEKGPFFNVSFQRSYREGNEWKTSTSFGKNDLLVIGLMATQAFKWIGSQAQEQEVSGT
jgi:hypothetical protein